MKREKSDPEQFATCLNNWLTRYRGGYRKRGGAASFY
jgi:hypothetical protein